MIDVLSLGQAERTLPRTGELREDPSLDKLKRVEILDILHGVKPDQVVAYREALGLSRYAGNTDSITILDLGCGSGWAGHVAIEEAVAQGVNANILYADINRPMLDHAVSHSLEHAREAAPGQIKVGAMETDLRELEALESIPDESLDIITMKMVRHEVPLSQQFHLMEQARNKLKPGGSLILWDALIPEHRDGSEKFNYTGFISEKDILQGRRVMAANRQFTTESALMRILNQAGFDVSGIENGHLYDDAPAKFLKKWKRKWNTIERWIVEMGNGSVNKHQKLIQAAQVFIPSARDVVFDGSIRDFLQERFNGQADILIPRLNLPDATLDKQIGVQGKEFEIESAILRVVKV